jgi:hypothetical protein
VGHAIHDVNRKDANARSWHPISSDAHAHSVHGTPALDTAQATHAPRGPCARGARGARRAAGRRAGLSIGLEGGERVLVARLQRLDQLLPARPPRLSRRQVRRCSRPLLCQGRRSAGLPAFPTINSAQQVCCLSRRTIACTGCSSGRSPHTPIACTKMKVAGVTPSGAVWPRPSGPAARRAALPRRRGRRAHRRYAVAVSSNGSDACCMALASAGAPRWLAASAAAAACSARRARDVVITSTNCGAAYRGCAEPRALPHATRHPRV